MTTDFPDKRETGKHYISPDKYVRTRRRHLDTLGTNKAADFRRLQPPAGDAFFRDDPSALPSSRTTSTVFDGCPADVMYTAGEVAADTAGGALSIVEAAALHTSNITAEDLIKYGGHRAAREALEKLLEKPPAVYNDPVTRDMLRESNEQIVANRGEVIGGELVDKLDRMHGQIAGDAYRQQKYHFEPGQLLESRYANITRNELLLHKQLNKEEARRSVDSEFDTRDAADTAVPTQRRPKTQQFPGPKIQFEDPIFARKDIENWESAEDVWNAKRKEQYKKGTEPVEIWGLQKVGAQQLAQANDEFEKLSALGDTELHGLGKVRIDNIGHVKAYLDSTRERWKRVNSQMKQMHQANPETVDTAAFQKLSKSRDALKRDGIKLSKVLESYKNSQKPGEMDAPHGLWELEDMDERAFSSKAEVEGWINVNKRANPELVYKPYKLELPRLTKPADVKARDIASIDAMQKRVANLRIMVGEVERLEATHAGLLQNYKRNPKVDTWDVKDQRTLIRWFEKYIAQPASMKRKTRQIRNRNKDVVRWNEETGKREVVPGYDTKTEYKSGYTQRLRGMLLSAEKRLEKTINAALENQRTADTPNLALYGYSPVDGYSKRSTEVYGPNDIARAREDYRSLQRDGHKVQFQWVSDKSAERLRLDSKTQVAVDPRAEENMQRTIQLTIDGESYLFGAKQLQMAKNAAVTARKRGKQVHLNYVGETLASEALGFVVRPRNRIKTKGGQSVPYTLPVGRKRDIERYKNIFTRTDVAAAPEFYIGPNMNKLRGNS